jgi:branched-chain amino acid transport system permease protein
MLADKVGEWVTVIIGAIFVVCVLAFRKGVVGEVHAIVERRRTRTAKTAAASPAERARGGEVHP